MKKLAYMQIFMYFCSRFIKLRYMKTRFSLLVALLFAGYSIAQVHIRIDDPETWSSDALIPYIGQTVIFDSPLVVSSNASYSTYIVGPRRLFTPTNQAYPRDTAAYNSVLRLNNSGAIELSDISGYHRCGEKIYNLKARVNSKNRLTWVSGSWKGNSRSDMENANIRKMVNVDGCDDCLLVCTMNLEYYLTTDFRPGSGQGPEDAAEHTTQRIKVSKALAQIGADLYGFVEIQQGQGAVAEIAADLNLYVNRTISDPDKKHEYTYINDKSQVNGTYTTAAFVYDAKKLKPIGVLQETSVAGASIPANRHRMICFEEIATGERFIFSVNHFKAKRGSGASGADADQHDGQGLFNAARTKEAQAVIDLYKGYYSNKAIKDKDILIMGDLNAYGKEDPIVRMISNGMIDLHRAFHADSSYSYQFGGLAGYLDHALVNATLFPQIKGVAAFNINSDERDSYTYESGDKTMFRCSDHDPVIVGLKLDSTLMYDPSPSMNVAEIASGEDNELIIHNAVKDGQRAFYAIYSINGTLIERKEILENDQREALPLSPGMYIVYLYAEGRVYQRKLIIR